MSDNVQGSNQDSGTNLKASLRPVDKSKPPPKKPPPQAPSTQDAGGDISAPRLPPKPKREQARVIYDYKAQHDDELTIKKGDIIIILSKGVEDEGWWKGELNGKIGVFPDNYIEVIKTPPMNEAILPLRTKKPERLNEKPPPPSCIGSPGGGIGSTNPTGSQTKLNISEVVRNNNNLKSTQQTPSPITVTTTNTTTTTTTTTTAINSHSTTNCSTTSSDNSSTPTSTVNPLTSSLTNSTEEESLSFISPVIPSKKSKFRAPTGSIPILPVPNLIKSSIIGASKPDVVPAHDNPSSKSESSGSCSKEPKSMSDERISTIINENEIILGSLDSTRRLKHPTANRVRGPNRRPPSMIVLTKDDDLDLFDEPKSESKIHSSSTSLSSTPATNTTSPTASTSTSTTGSTNDLTEKSPSVPPWMKELKKSQAERRFKSNDTTTSIVGGEEIHGGFNQATPLSPTKSNPSRSISLPVEINETNNSSSSLTSTTITTTTPSSPSTVNSLLSGKPKIAAKPSSVVAAIASTVPAPVTEFSLRRTMWGSGDVYLFNPADIESLNWTDTQSDYKTKLDSNSLIIRPLKIDDYDRSHTKLLSQLTVVGDLSQQEYEDRFKLIKETRIIRIVVIEDTKRNLIVATATLILEPKFIHSCGWAGHIEEVCVDEAYRGKGLGKLIVNCLKLLARQAGAYKVGLDCNDDKIAFYATLGFKQEARRANYLACRF